jgi:hypothetical protein
MGIFSRAVGVTSPSRRESVTTAAVADAYADFAVAQREYLTKEFASRQMASARAFRAPPV